MSQLAVEGAVPRPTGCLRLVPQGHGDFLTQGVSSLVTHRYISKSLDSTFV